MPFVQCTSQAIIRFPYNVASDVIVRGQLYSISRRREGDYTVYTIKNRGGKFIVYENGLIITDRKSLTGDDIGTVSRTHDLGHLTVVEDTHKTVAIIATDTTTRQVT